AIQQTIPAPDKRLREPTRSEFIQLNAAKQFPLQSQALALDYRDEVENNTELLVTAARQQEIQCWQHCLQNAGLSPDVIDIAPCALRYMAAASGLSTEHILVHRLESEWLWASPLNTPFRYGLIPLTEDIFEQLRHAYPAKRDQALKIYHSSIIDEQPPANTIIWSLFSAFKQFQPPLPALPMAFTLAGGLAIRIADY
ncbi:Competence protein A, partial [Candidatus Regiella insecticola 5.15]